MPLNILMIIQLVLKDEFRLLDKLTEMCFISFSFLLVTKGRHELVPKDIREEAEKYAKVSNSSSGNIQFSS